LSYLQTENPFSLTSNELEVLWRLIDSNQILNSNQLSKYEKNNFGLLNYRTCGHVTNRLKSDNRLKVVKTIPKGHTQYYFRPTTIGFVGFFKNIDTARYNIGTTNKVKEKLVDILPNVIDEIYKEPFTENKILTCISLAAKSIEIKINDESYLIKVSIEIESKNDEPYYFNFSIPVKKLKINESLLEVFQYLVILQYGLRWRNSFSGYEFEQFQKRVLKKFTNPKLKTITESILFLQNKISGVTQRTSNSIDEEVII
jgi:hypothetical protein